jgi:hypothetical protein
MLFSESSLVYLEPFLSRFPCFQNLSSLLAPFLRSLLVLNFPCSDFSYPYCAKATIDLGDVILTNYNCYQSVYTGVLDGLVHEHLCTQFDRHQYAQHQLNNQQQ